MSVNVEDVKFFQENGYLVLKGLFSKAECEDLREHFMEIRKGQTPMDDAGHEIGIENDPLKAFPRIIHPHRWDEKSLRWMLDDRLRDAMTAMLGEEPFAGQTMFYFKPAGSRGQALHQDQKYLRVEPGTCVAAWLALDRCDEENGCLEVVPGTHTIDLLCTTEADLTKSFTGDTVPLPEGMSPVPVIMEPGDVLFFNGSLVHGSGPNRSQDRFRRALIGHYLTGNAETVSHFYMPAYRFDGTEVTHLQATPDGGQCGVWVEKDGATVLELRDISNLAVAGPH